MTPDRHPSPDEGDATEPRRWGTRWWLMRLTFSFLIIGVVAAYEGWQAHQRNDDMRAALLMIAAAAGITLAAAGLYVRHRRRL
jgi:hypothetical protein